MMNKKRILLILFACLVLVQLYVPASMIVKRELTLSEGVEYKFRAVPVDPGDPFRGRFVSINVENNKVPVSDNADYENNQTVYVQLEKDAEGFSKMISVSKEQPKNSAYFKTKVLYMDRVGGGANTVNVKIPFDRYYMEEKAAPEAEKAYREKVKDAEKDVYVTVRIKDGFAVLEKLYINGVTIEEYLKKQ